jgi:hypothetical protein
VEQKLAEPLSHLYLTLAKVREGIGNNRNVVLVYYIALAVAGGEDD